MVKKDLCNENQWLVYSYHGARAWQTDVQSTPCYDLSQ